MILFSCKPEAEKPTVVTKSVGEITQTTAKIVGQVTADGGAEVTERGVCWNTTGAPEVIDYRTVDGTGIGTFNSNISDLVPNTQYYVRAYATNEMGTSYGDEKSFTTLEVIPEEPEEPEEPEGPEEPEEPENPEQPEGPENPEQPEDPEGPENPENPENPEQPENPENPEQPEQPVGPVVITAEVTEITTNSAKCGGEVVSGGNGVIVARGVCWSTNHNPTDSDAYTVNGNGVGSYTSNMTNLEHNTTYYVRAYATNAQGVVFYGNEVSFKTLEKRLPVVMTNSEVTGITMSSAVCGGEVSLDGNSETTRGICWSTSQNPTIDDSKTIDGKGIGSYTSYINNLEQNTTYYVRAYATNEIGTVYGEEKTFQTLAAYSPATGTSNGYGYVDLGLSVKWATCNVGATSPEEYGNYYAWGETITKKTYTSNNCTTENVFFKYDFSGESKYDAATANWGVDWRMPTLDELIELHENCTWEWISSNDFKGCKVTGPNGNSIFLPAAGFYYESSLVEAGDRGFYWSSSPIGNQTFFAYSLGFYNSSHGVTNIQNRYDGLSVRPVLE